MKQNMVIKLLLILALVASSIIPFSGYVVFFILFLFMLFRGRLIRFFDSLKENKPIILFLIYISFSLLKSNYKSDSLVGVVVVFISIYIYLVVRKYVYSINETIDIFKYFVISNIIISIYGIIQFYFISDVYFASSWVDSNIYNINMRAYSSLLNPNVLGGYLVFCICLQLTALEHIRARRINVISLLLSSICLILTYSRGAWITLFIIVFLMYFYRKRIVYVFYSLLFFLSITMINGSSGLERISLNKTLHDHSFHYRIDIYQSIFKIIKENFIFGTGLNTMKHYISNYSHVIEAPVDHAHNLILNIVAETGFIGLAFFSVFFIALIKDIFIIYKFQDPIYKDISISSFLAFLSILIHGIIDAPIIAPQFLFFVIFIYSFVKNIRCYKILK